MRAVTRKKQSRAIDILGMLIAIASVSVMLTVIAVSVNVRTLILLVGTGVQALIIPLILMIAMMR